MAGTAGSGGLGALAIGGIATVAVVIGGVVTMQLGVFKGEPPIGEQGETTGQIAPVVPVAVLPDAADLTEPAETDAQAADESQNDTNAKAAETLDQPAEVSSVETSITEDGGVQVATTVQLPEQSEPSVEAADIASSAESGADVVAEEEPDAPAALIESIVENISEPISETVAQEPVEQIVEAPVVETTTGATQVEQPEETVIAAQALPETSDPETVQEPVFVLAAPELDLVRFESDGTGVIAGRAQAGVLVAVLLDGKILDQFQVQNGGEFASFISIEPSVDARVVSLRAAFDGQMVMSDATFILAPTVAVTAQVENVEQALQVQAAPADETPEVVVQDLVEPVQKLQQDVAALDLDVGDTGAAKVEDVALASEETTADPAKVEEPAAVSTSDDTKTAETEVDVAQAEDVVVAADAAVVASPQPVAQPAPEIAPEPQASPIAVAVLKADSEGVELVQPASPVAADLLGKVSLDIISYSDEGDVQLAGRARPASLVRVYLDNSPVADIRAADDGRWKVQLSDVVPGIYTLRVDELDAEGKVLSRLETPFKRESPEALRPPAAPEGSPVQPEPPIRAVTVQKGDTLWAISRERYGDGLLYVRVFEANKTAIRDPDLIYPGQIFSIPE